jgi:tetratricopeptide (TPR) repeat protein
MLDFDDLDDRIRKSNLKQILLEIDNEILKHQENTEVYFKLQYYKAKALKFLDNYEEGLNLLKKISQKCLELKSSILHIDCSILMAEIYSYKGELKTSLKMLVKIEDDLKDCEKCTPLEKKLKQIEICNIKSSTFWRNGDLEKSIEIISQALNYRKEVGDNREIGRSLFLAGTYQSEMGDLVKGIKTMNQSLKILQKNKDLVNCSYVLNNIGWTYKIQGKLDLALKFITESVEIKRKIASKQSVRIQLANIGVINWQKGNQSEAISYLNESLEFERKIGNKLEIADCLFYLFTIKLNQKALFHAQKFLEELKQLNESEGDNKRLDAIYRVAYALLLKSKPRAKNIYEAQEILKRLIESDVAKFEITVIAMVNLCDLYLYELTNSDDEDILNEITITLQKLLLIAKKHNSYHLWAEIYLIQAKFALVQLDLKNARILLTKAQKLSDSKGLTQLAMNISRTHDELLEKYNLWRSLKQSKLSISERIRIAEINNQMERLLRQGESNDVKLKYEIPIGLNILNENGIVIYSKSFASEWIVDENLFGAFISAFHSFSGEIFSENFDRAKFGEYYILMRAASPLLFCYIFKGQSYHAIKKMDNFIEKIKKNTEIWDTLIQYLKFNEVFSNSPFPAFNEVLTQVFSS